MKTCTCQKCGKEIEYKTNKPKYCSECKEQKGTKARKKKQGGRSPSNKWKKEAIMFHMLMNLFNADYIINGYYSWLPSPKNEPMQLDWYCPEHKIAYEYNGRQHYEYTSYFHKSKKAFKYLQDCDKLKSELCKKNEVTLVHIRYDKKLTYRYLLLKLEEANPELYRKLIDSKVINTDCKDE